MAEPKTAKWVDASAIYGVGAVKLVTANGATIARVRPPFAGIARVWYYSAGRSGGGPAIDCADGISACERWARSRGYTIEREVAS